MPEQPDRPNDPPTETDSNIPGDTAGDTSAATDKDTAGNTAGDTSEAPVSSDVKAAFAAALERKKQAGQSRSAHLDGHGGVAGSTASHKATRTFRRKSG